MGMRLLCGVCGGYVWCVGCVGCVVGMCGKLQGCLLEQSTAYCMMREQCLPN